MNRLPLRALILAFVLLAFAVWLGALVQRHIWADELATIRVLELPDIQSVAAFVASNERHPPLYFIAIWLWGHVAGTGEFALRYFSLWLLTLSIPLAFALARTLARLYRSQPANMPWLAALLMSFAPSLALYGVMIRYHATDIVLALLLTLCLARWMLLARRAPTEAPRGPLTLFSTVMLASLVQRYEATALARRAQRVRRRTWLMLAWTAVAVMFLYSDYSALALIGAQVLWLWLERREQDTSLYPWAAAALVLGIAFLPLLPNLLLKAGGGGTLADLAGDPRGLILRIVYPAFSYTFGESILPWHVTVLVAAALLTLAYIALARASQIRRLTAFLLWQQIACLAFNVLVFSTVAADLPFVTIASRSMFVLPLYLILLATALANLPALWRTLATAGLLIANFAALFNLFAGVEYHNPIFAVPVRAVVDAVAQGSRPGDIVISDYDTSFYYYWDQNPPQGVKHYLTEPEALPQAEDAVASGEHPHVWLLVYGRDRSRDIDHTVTFEALLAPRYKLVAERGYAPVDALYRMVKSKLIGREAYAYKLLVRVYERKQ